MDHVHFTDRGRSVVVRTWAEAAVRTALNYSTLHEWASVQQSREAMQGRGVHYGVLLPTDPPTAAVVRRNRHGGLFGSLTGEYFLLPTRAPLELEIMLRLAASGVPVPEIIGYVIYPAVGIFARSDVITRRLPQGNDLPAAWNNASPTEREAILEQTRILLEKLEKAGAWHADLNMKNIYIACTPAGPAAYLLDVDRVTFPNSRDVALRNFKRLARSVRKWRNQKGLDFCEDALARLTPCGREGR